MPTVAVDDERELIHDILLRLGAPPALAEIQAEWLIEADLRGHPSHGLHRLSVIADRIAAGLTVPDAEPELTWASPSSLVVDGRRGLGPCVGVQTVDALLERVPEAGIALGAVHNANHLGLLAPYVERCAAAGKIGLALTTSEALVHPWGGRIAQVGTNPIAVGVPAEPEPFVFDMATGAVSMGKVIDHRNRGMPLEPGWAIDGEGRPTVDAARALSGAIAPFGGSKGYGLSLAFELIVAAVTGSALGREVTGTLDVATPCNKGDLFLCIDPAVLGAVDVVPRVSRYLDAVRATPPQDGFGAVRVPGDRARAERLRRIVEGVPIADGVWDSLQSLRRRLRAAA